MDSSTVGFLTPEPVLFHGHAQGFALFGMGHLVSLAASAFIIAFALRTYLSLTTNLDEAPSGQRRLALCAMSGTAVLIICGKCLSYAALGILEPLFWPLHVCNLSEFVALGYTLGPQSRMGRRLADLLFCWGISGCAAALLFPGWHGYCPVWSLASLCGFVEHALVLACALCPLVGGDYSPQPRRVWFVVLVTVACGALFRAVNPLLGTNFFFVTNPAAAGGPGPWLLATFGDPGFLLPYLMLAMGLWAAQYAVWCVARRDNRGGMPHRATHR